MTESSGTGIRILDDETINQIAAGEVVERPASIVKELVENAVDAGATRITVEISSTGKEVVRIRIIDDGSGIRSSEVPLAFFPHATSKIRTTEDLNSCLTLGFRGEALASIAAIAYVTLVTRHRDEDAGLRYIISGGEVLEQGEIGSPPGTTLTIEEIFFTTPARRKFLKSISTELGRIAEVIEIFSLLYPEITFRYLLNGQEKMASYGATSLGEVLRKLRPDDAVHLIPVSFQAGGVSITGYLSHPSYSKKTSQRMMFAVNGRFITSSRLMNAVRAGYRTLLPSGTYPVSVLLLTLDPDKVDANIHPTKREIRFSDEQTVLKVIHEAVRETLQQADLSHPGQSTERIVGLHTTDLNPEPVNEIRYPAPLSRSQQVCEATLAGYRATTRQLRQTRLLLDTDADLPPSRFPPLTYVGQVAATYLVASNEGGDLVLIDQHAAHERVRYDQLKRDQAARTLSQELIVPVVLTLTQSEAHHLSDIKEDLEEEGFLLEPFGKDSWCVRGVPVVLGRCEDPEAVREIISAALSGREEAGIREGVSRLVACRGAVKAGVILSPEQGEEIISQLSLTSEPFTCPHGRPTIVSFSRGRLEELFKRR
ncbi:MAG TPA: DNA mismatch repair endonuclease MutL [Methanospirillum sp.]|nr:DNA mismatch repair endonuclease MutL [Methanospirillum sp.]